MFYVTIAKDQLRPEDAYLLAAGPYRTHGAALRAVVPVRRAADEIDRMAPWYAYGTCRVKGPERLGEPMPEGRLNDEVGYEGPGELP